MIALLQPLIDALLAQTPAEAAAAWPNGPTPLGARATVQTPVQQYIAWVQQVEQALVGRRPNEILRRIRRMHYSDFSLKVDPNEPSTTSQALDSLIGSTLDNPGDEPPLVVSADLPQSLLDGLFATRAIVTQAGHVVDIRHALNIMDFAYNGTGFGDGLMIRLSTFVPGYATVDPSIVFSSLGWIGDLGSVWKTWMFRRGPDSDQPAVLAGAERTAFEQCFADRCTIDDLLGDIDGAVMATMPHDELLSVRLSSYYSNETTATALNANGPNARQRFHYFLDRSIPELARTRLGTSPLRVSCDKENTAVVEKLLRALGGSIWRKQHDVAERLPDTHDPIFRELSNRMIKWFQDGVADPACGVPSWPGPTAVPT